MKNWNHLPPYPVHKYPRICQTADIALFSVMDKELGVLLIKRAEEPYQGCWALPGGFLDVAQDEDIGHTAKRELEEETGVTGFYLEQLFTFSKKERDPRELVSTEPCRIISVAHYALIDSEKVKTIAGSDAKEVKWFKLSSLPELAFDHQEIIQAAVGRIRNKINYTNVGFELVPETFTIPDLREVFEKVLGKKLNPTNFRTKLLKMKLLDPVGTKRIVGRGQPAPLYKLNRKRLSQLKTGESIF